MILYKATLRKNFSTGDKLFYPTTACTQCTEYDDLLNDIQRACSLTMPDVKAIVKSFEENITDALAQGRTVTIPELGTFSISFRTETVEAPEQVCADLIKSAHARFKPSPELKHQIRKDNVHFERVNE